MNVRHKEQDVHHVNKLSRPIIQEFKTGYDSISSDYTCQRTVSTCQDLYIISLATAPLSST